MTQPQVDTVDQVAALPPRAAGGAARARRNGGGPAVQPGGAKRAGCSAPGASGRARSESGEDGAAPDRRRRPRPRGRQAVAATGERPAGGRGSGRRNRRSTTKRRDSRPAPPSIELSLDKIARAWSDHPRPGEEAQDSAFLGTAGRPPGGAGRRRAHCSVFPPGAEFHKSQAEKPENLAVRHRGARGDDRRARSRSGVRWPGGHDAGETTAQSDRGRCAHHGRRHRDDQARPGRGRDLRKLVTTRRVSERSTMNAT